MDIAEVTRRKADLERAVAVLLDAFETETGVAVTRVERTSNLMRYPNDRWAYDYTVGIVIEIL